MNLADCVSGKANTNGNDRPMEQRTNARRWFYRICPTQLRA